jgi:hypothetical protein
MPGDRRRDEKHADLCIGQLLAVDIPVHAGTHHRVVPRGALLFDHKVKGGRDVPTMHFSSLFD